MALRICEMELRHVDAALRLFADVSNEKLWIGTEPDFDKEQYRDVLGRAIGLGNAMFIAEDGDDIVGLLTAFEHAEYGWTIGMMVDESHRGLGIGRALMERLFQWATARQIPHLSLLVFPHNERALRLYRATGFTEVERYENDVRRNTGEVWDTILMRKTFA